MMDLLNNKEAVNLVVLFTIYFCSFYTYSHLRGPYLQRSRFIPVGIVVSILLILIAFAGGNRYIITKICYLILLFLSLFAISRDRFDSIPICLVSIALAHGIAYLGVLFGGTVAYLVGVTQYDLLSIMLSCIIQIGITIVLVKNKHISNALKYFNKKKHYEFGLLLSVYVFIFSLILTQPKVVTSEIGSILFMGIPLVIALLILWIRSIVQRYYKNKLQDRANEYTKQEIEDKDKRIEQLESEVSTLAKQLHRDNHLMTSVDHSVQELAECDSAEQREKIIGEIHTLYLERNDSMAREQQKNKILPSTGFALIDSSLSELYVKAAARGIGFDLTVSEEPYYLVNNIISQTDLQTLLCDHIKDAIIAVETAGITNGRILVTIEKNDSIFEITIRDNGVDFEPDTLAKLGREQVTTHAADGGSGIGFMTTFETLQKTKGSLIITEYEQKTPFSKSVAFMFDGLNRFVISTYRKEELEKATNREDILIQS